MTVTHTDYLLKEVGTSPVVTTIATTLSGVWIRLRNNDTTTDYYSTAVTDSGGGFTHSAPPGDYSLYSGTAATVVGTPDIRNTHYAVPVTSEFVDSALVHLAGTETISGVKSFSIPPRFARGPFYDAPYYGAVGNGSTDDSAAIQTAIDAAASDGGATVQLSSVTVGTPPVYGLANCLVVSTKNVFIKGIGANHRGGIATHAGTTTLKGLTAGMTLLKFAPPAVGASNNFGFGGVSDVFFAANSQLANTGLDVQTWLYGTFERLGFDLFATTALHHGVIPTWDLVNLSRSSQHNRFDTISFGDVAVQAVGQVYMRIDGDTTGGLPQAGDASVNEYRNMTFIFSNGDAIQCGDSDNELFENLLIFRSAGGTGNALILEGGASTLVVARAHTFIRYTANAPTIVRGTETYTAASYGHQFIGFDDDNATPAPTIGTGVTGVGWQDHHGKYTNLGLGGNVPFGPSPQVATPSNTGGQVLHIYNDGATVIPELRIEGTGNSSFADTNWYAKTAGGVAVRTRLLNAGSGGTSQFGTITAHPLKLMANNQFRQILLSAGGTQFLDAVGTSVMLTVDVSGNVVLTTATGTQIGTATAQKLAFHGSTAVIQRAGAAQVAAAATASTNTTPFGYTTAAQADAIVTLLNELRAAMVEKGLIKGAA